MPGLGMTVESCRWCRAQATRDVVGRSWIQNTADIFGRRERRLGRLRDFVGRRQDRHYALGPRVVVPQDRQACHRLLDRDKSAFGLANRPPACAM